MTTLSGVPSRYDGRAAAVVGGALILLLGPIAVGASVPLASAFAAVAVWMFAARRHLLQWRVLLSTLLIVILFIPIGRYQLPASLPFQLEPYRVLVALLLGCWVAGLLIDPRIKLLKTGLEGPLIVSGFAALASVVANGARIQSLGLDSDVFKALSFFGSFVLVLYMVASVGRARATVDRLLSVLVVGGAVVALAAIWESRSGYNVFDHLRAPFLQRVFENTEGPRGGNFRAFGPAEHPIALSALLAMLVPIAIYFARVQGKRRWWIAASMLTAGSIATVSRTGILMLVIEALWLLTVRPHWIKRLWPALLPLVVAVHFALPGTLGTLKEAFFPTGGLVAEQEGYKGTGRLGDWGPTLSQVAKQPALGIGYGTRITSGPGTNSRILDDEWLATLLSTGALGFIALAWLFLRAIRRLTARARSDTSADGSLAAALAAAIVGFAAGMWTYDAFSFTQVTFVLYVLLGISSVILTRRRTEGVDGEAGPLNLPERPSGLSA